MKTLIIFVLLASALEASGADFMTLCLAKKRPVGFDNFVKSALVMDKVVIEFEKKASCLKMEPFIKTAPTIRLDEPLVPLTLLELLPELESLNLHIETSLTSLKFGHHPHLTNFSIQGPLNLQDLGDLLSSPDIVSMAIVGMDDHSSIDIRQLSQFPKLALLFLQNLTIKNAQTLETLPELNDLTLKNIKLDRELDWKHFKKLERKTVE